MPTHTSFLASSDPDSQNLSQLVTHLHSKGLHPNCTFWHKSAHSSHCISVKQAFPLFLTPQTSNSFLCCVHLYTGNSRHISYHLLHTLASTSGFSQMASWQRCTCSSLNPLSPLHTLLSLSLSFMSFF